MRIVTLVALVALPALSAGAAGCKNPADDKPKAVVTAPSTASATPVAEPDPAPADVKRFTFSGDGSTVGFVGSKVTGSHAGGFKQFSGTVTVAGKTETGKVTLEIDMASLFTNDEKLTGHLLSPDFFDAAKFAKATFVSTSVAPVADKENEYTVTGDLELHGVKKGISFPTTVLQGQDTGTVEVKSEFAINRKDFGIVYPGKPDDLIRDEVVIKLAILARPAAN